MQRVEDVLPGTHGLRRADVQRSPAVAARTKSGTRRSAARSPPPMTFPARTLATPTPRGASSASRNDAVTSSWHAFEAA